MTRAAHLFVLGILLTGAIATSIGCTKTNYVRKDDPISLTVSPSSTKVFVGETVTFFTRTEHTLGHKPELKWTTTGGSVKTIEAGSTAQVTFDKPGTYTVDAYLSAEGHEVQHTATLITVSPIPQ